MWQFPPRIDTWSGGPLCLTKPKNIRDFCSKLTPQIDPLDLSFVSGATALKENESLKPAPLLSPPLTTERKLNKKSIYGTTTCVIGRGVESTSPKTKIKCSKSRSLGFVLIKINSH